MFSGRSSGLSSKYCTSRSTVLTIDVVCLYTDTTSIVNTVVAEKSERVRVTLR